jgi:RHS repeat-associated protein
MSRKSRVINNINISAQIVYDSNGQLTLFTLYPDSGGKVVITSAYDADGSQISNICTTYDANGNILSREEMPLPTVTTETVSTTETVIPNPPVADEESVYSATSSFFSEADLWLLEADLLYSRGSMLMSAPSAPPALSEEFIYDHLGNRYQHTDKYDNLYTYLHNSVNQFQKKETDIFGYHLEYSYTYDYNGNLEIDENGRVYSYDYRNRLVSISDGVNTIAEYFYDALGRRIAKTVGDTTTLFYYNSGQQVIAEYEGSTTPQLVRDYVYGNDITEILAMFLPQYDVSQEDFDQFLGFCESWLSEYGQTAYQAQFDHNSDHKIDYRDFAYFASVWGAFPSNEESHYYYMHDALGSIRGLIGGKFSREDDREFYNYDIYGATTDTSSAGNPFMFAGYRYDAETGLYHTMFRPYAPNIGRWLLFDPIADTLNLYEYVANNPIMYIDPYGLKKIYITIFNYWQNLKMNKAVEKEVRRAFNNCFKKCIPKDPCTNKPAHQVIVKFAKVSERKYDSVDTGWQDQKRWQNPHYNIKSTDDYSGSNIAQTRGNRILVNSERYNQSPVASDTALGTVLTHEISAHIYAGPLQQWGHRDNEGWIDSKNPQIGGELSEAACNDLCKMLEINTNE